jgi:hypothetical protein
VSEKQAVLFANEAFYRAFADGDLDAMDAMWAREAPVACIHPGWNLISGRDEVMESWRSILESANRPAVRNHGARAFLYGDTAFVICYEALEEGFLVATNVFVVENGALEDGASSGGPHGAPRPRRVRRSRQRDALIVPCGRSLGGRSLAPRPPDKNSIMKTI